MILTTEGVITAALNVISATTTVILAKEEVITASLGGYLSHYKGDLGRKQTSVSH